MPQFYSGPSDAPLQPDGKAKGGGMESRSRFGLSLGFPQHGFTRFPLPIDTWVKRGIYSPHLDFRPIVSVAAGVASGAMGSKGFQFERLGRSRSFKQPRLCLKSAWRSDASGNLGPIAFPVQNGRLAFDFRQAWESGSPAPQSWKAPRSQPDLPRLQPEQRSSDERLCDFSDIPCFSEIRHGRDFNAIRRGQ